MPNRHVHPLMQMMLDAFALPMRDDEPVVCPKYLARSLDNLAPAFPTSGLTPWSEYSHAWRRQMSQWVDWTLSDFAVQPNNELDAQIVLDRAATDEKGNPLTLNETRLLGSCIRDRYVIRQAIEDARERDDLRDRLHRPDFYFRG